MVYLKGLSVLLLTASGMVGLITCKNHNKPGIEKVADIAKDKKGFVVLELFTSEGCSSCPPADNLMAKIQKEYNDQPVYLLAFHVDYWDRQGWKDIFSNPDYTNRQQEYETWFNTGSIYTPQLVVNGNAEFVGSNEVTIRNAITKALATEYKTKLSIQSNRKADKLVLNYQVSDDSTDRRLLIAIVQKSATTKVERGENKGRLLSHVQIVRSLHSESLTNEAKGTTTIQLPQSFNQAEWEVVAMVQDLNKGEILTAAKVGL